MQNSEAREALRAAIAAWDGLTEEQRQAELERAERAAQEARLDAFYRDHVARTNPPDRRSTETEPPSFQLPPAYRDAGYGDMTPLEQRRMDGDR